MERGPGAGCNLFTTCWLQHIYAAVHCRRVEPVDGMEAVSSAFNCMFLIFSGSLSQNQGIML